MRIGEITVEPLSDGAMPVPISMLYPDVPLAEWRSLPGDIVDKHGMFTISSAGFLATDRQVHNVVFDLGIGCTPKLPGGEVPAVRDLLPDQLEKLGCPLDTVTDVVFSHLHIDHVGWASTEGVATFPGARHHVHAADWAYFVDGDADETIREIVSPVRDSAALWEGESISPFDWLRIVHAPGHTPGASIALIESQGERLALTGDLFHHPAALKHPDWRCGFDWDAETATATRWAWLKRLGETGTPLVGPHFPGQKPVTLL